MFPELRKKMLQRLKTAQDNGAPLTTSQLGHEVHGSTFEDLWQQGHITIQGQDGQLVCVANKSSRYVVTPSGLKHLASL